MSQQQTSAFVSLLRRMLDDMAMRGLHEDTQRNTIMSVRNFAAFLGRSPETATAGDVHRFQVHQADSGVQPPTVNDAVSGLHFLFNVTLVRPDLSRRLVLARFSGRSAGRDGPRRASRRRPNSCWDVRPWRRATPQTEFPSA